MKILPAIVSITLFSAFLDTTSHASLVGYWPFDEGSGTTTADASGNGHTGQLSAGAIWASDAVQGTYLSFNGTDGDVDPSLFLPVMTDTSDFTWAFFANNQLISTDTTQQNSVVVGNRYNGVGAIDFDPRQFIKLTPTQFEWHQNANGNDNLDYPDFALDEWHHHAIVKTGTNLDYYYDGTFLSSRTLTEAIGIEANPFFIGGQPGSAGTNEFFNGFIDDVRVYDNALSPAEVAAIAVPEPSVFAFGICGLGALLMRRRR